MILVFYDSVTGVITQVSEGSQQFNITGFAVATVTNKTAAEASSGLWIVDLTSVAGTFPNITCSLITNPSPVVPTTPGILPEVVQTQLLSRLLWS